MRPPDRCRSRGLEAPSGAIGRSYASRRPDRQPPVRLKEQRQAADRYSSRSGAALTTGCASSTAPADQAAAPSGRSWTTLSPSSASPEIARSRYASQITMAPSFAMHRFPPRNEMA